LGYNLDMAENAVVRSRINVIVKDQATAVLETMGLSVSDVMRVLLTRIAKDKAIPFDLNPNKLTRETLRKSARGEGVHRAKNAKDLFEKLGI
jgi:DNA-damage-inducible protein J